MSTTLSPGATKNVTLRIITPPRTESNRLLEQLGPAQKLESGTIVLDSGRLTTDEIARYIREYLKLRDETLHAIRQLGVERHAQNVAGTPRDIARQLDPHWKRLTEIRTRYRDLQAQMEILEKQLDDSKKKVALIRQVLETGFGIEEVRGSKGFGFARILGRVPSRRLQDAQKALQSNLKEQAFIATGTQKGDWTHILVAVPSDKATSALQTLVLHDFSPMEIPNVEQPDLKAALDEETRRLDSVSKQLDEARRKLNEFVKNSSGEINGLMDNAIESLIYLRAVLRIGEGIKAQHTFAVLAKSPTAKALDALTKSGALVESE